MASFLAPSLPKMKRLSSKFIRLLLTAFALALLPASGLFYSRAEATRSGRAPAGVEFESLRNNNDLILFKRGAVDTSARLDLNTASEDLRVASAKLMGLKDAGRKQVRVVQFRGPVKQSWIKALKATGSEIIGYIPNNAYIIRGSDREIARAANLYGYADTERADDLWPIKWMSRLQPIQKIDTAYTEDRLAAGENDSVNVEIELLDCAESDEAIAYVNKVASSVNRAPRRFLDFVVLSVAMPVGELLNVAAFDETLFISEATEATPLDERSAQIIAGNLTSDGTQPVSPGYVDWLRSKGLATRPDFIIDFTDTGLDRGSTSAGLIHPGFLDAEGRSRVVYNTNYARDISEDRGGHGTLVASVAVGLGLSEFTDATGHMFGMGVDPTIGLGASRIFDTQRRLPFQLSFTEVASTAYAAGARMSNNSWSQGGNTYDASSQEFDALARDARPDLPGNQEMFFVFSAGNTGPGGNIGSPGNAKNVITVAASENFRPEGSDSCDLDGGGAIGPEGANSALDILRFSSGGPTADGRAKPDICAPGTHIYGAVSRAPFFTGNGLCPGVGLYQPPGQSLYTWSSGTSLASPHVTGAASLTRRFFTVNNLSGNGQPPSSAMTKAFLINSASYLTGENAGGNLPSERQGWGRVNLTRAFDDTPRKLVDQTNTFTESGQEFVIKGSLADRNRPLCVTLAWTDAPGSLAGPALVNDLDLEIKVGGETIYRGNNFGGPLAISGGVADRLNNVEGITLTAGAIPEGFEGNFTITVRAHNIAGDGVPGNGSDLDQDFALVIYNITAPIAEPPPPPPRKIPVITAATYVKKVLTITGRDFTAAARVEINGQLSGQTFEFNAATNSLSVKKKKKKLKLNSGVDNQIVIIENNERSAPFILRL